MPESDIAGRIAAWMDDRAHNALFPGSDMPAFATPLIGYADGADPLFTRIKEDIGPEFYWTPRQAFALAFPDDAPPPADALTVIAWILPQTAATRAAHRACRDLPDIAWSRARHFGEMVNERLRAFVVETLSREGIRAVAPTLLPQWGRRLSPRLRIAQSYGEEERRECERGNPLKRVLPSRALPFLNFLIIGMFHFHFPIRKEAWQESVPNQAVGVPAKKETGGPFGPPAIYPRGCRA
ncbi:hypothetical protein DesfrDRAFT_1077 [Solidesulfovibrio fructosivorans JJ]]|uniref:Uncharacterized protein n=1 Tax=Solidesulfovibrio fructosivorans JJ] TaxID=596151 RepID=E1JTX8_SOLFR|nr:hypothetical protein [Solidesulfovibrio fructosivorans]EFL52257.1 hypothetical protein DesfrDRAFT_1077 [Solidesulfovibrio fructosivorans JJ]]